jgi:hypothetical protein
MLHKTNITEIRKCCCWLFPTKCILAFRLGDDNRWTAEASSSYEKIGHSWHRRVAVFACARMWRETDSCVVWNFNWSCCKFWRHFCMMQFLIHFSCVCIYHPTYPSIFLPMYLPLLYLSFYCLYFILKLQCFRFPVIHCLCLPFYLYFFVQLLFFHYIFLFIYLCTFVSLSFCSPLFPVLPRK